MGKVLLLVSPFDREKRLKHTQKNPLAPLLTAGKVTKPKQSSFQASAPYYGAYPQLFSYESVRDA